MNALLALIIWFSVGGPTALAAPVGAAVSWVAYSDREDFIEDRKVIKQIIEDGSANTFFAIPADRHFETSPYSGFETPSAINPSFQINLRQAVDSLIEVTARESSAEPFLAVVVATHGGDGVLCQSAGGTVPLSKFAGKLLDEQIRFRNRTGKPLRLEVIYSACHSGSLIRTMETQVDITHHLIGRNFGPVSVITTTTATKIAYSSTDIGEYLLSLILHLHDGAKIAVEGLPLAHWPSVAAFGFFNYLGATSYNHPQVYSSEFQYPEANTIHFLNWYSSSPAAKNNAGNRLNQTSGGMIFDRDLNINFARLMKAAVTIDDIDELLGFQLWNFGPAETIPLLATYLDHSRREVSYAAALKILGYHHSGHHYGFDQNQAAFVDNARKVFLASLNKPKFLRLLNDSKHAAIWYETIVLELPSGPDQLEKTIKLIGEIYAKKIVLAFERLGMDKLRAILKEQFRIEVRDLYSERSSARPSQHNLSQVPEAMLELIVKLYFKLPPDLIGAENLIKEIVDRTKGTPRARQSAAFACQKILGAPITRVELEKIVSEIIYQYDRGLYVAN